MADKRLFEQGSDVDPILTHRVAMGLAANSTKNSTWSKIVTWLEGKLSLSISNVSNLETEQAIVQIGAWDMSSSLEINVTHGIADHTKIRGVSVVILPDSGTSIYTDKYINIGTGVKYAGVRGIDATGIWVQILSGGFFNSSSFSGAFINRGYLLIDLIP